ncbi:MAG: putative glyoxalase [Bryobacterales bacterium]|nr:putative glyoxalase [Bryobacterales bacterium]
MEPLTISMLMLGVSDLPRSITFYRDILELKLASQTDNFAFFGAGAVTLILSAPLGRTREPIAGALEVIFPVTSVMAAHADLAQRGAGFISPPHEVSPSSWAANFTDPDGHILSVFGPK